ILAAPNVGHDGIRNRIVEHPVDSKVAAASDLFRGRKGHRLRTTAIQICAVGAKGSNLKFPVILKHADDPELGADRNCPSKNSLDLFRTRVGCHVDIFWSKTEEGITDASTGEIGNMTVAAQMANDRSRNFYQWG